MERERKKKIRCIFIYRNSYSPDIFIFIIILLFIIFSKESCDAFLQLLRERNVPLPTFPFTLPRLLDQVISHFLEPECTHPTFLCDHPISLSPLARHHPNFPNQSGRFELFIAGKELINAYSELNDPEEQQKRFRIQQEDRLRGDFDMPNMNFDYCQALEYALPPTAGWGLGIDRLCMLLTVSRHLRDVITFPTASSAKEY